MSTRTSAGNTVTKIGATMYGEGEQMYGMVSDTLQVRLMLHSLEYRRHGSVLICESTESG